MIFRMVVKKEDPLFQIFFADFPSEGPVYVIYHVYDISDVFGSFPCILRISSTGCVRGAII